MDDIKEKIDTCDMNARQGMQRLNEVTGKGNWDRAIDQVRIKSKFDKGMQLICRSARRKIFKTRGLRVGTPKWDVYAREMFVSFEKKVRDYPFSALIMPIFILYRNEFLRQYCVSEESQA